MNLWRWLRRRLGLRVAVKSITISNYWRDGMVVTTEFEDGHKIVRKQPVIGKFLGGWIDQAGFHGYAEMNAEGQRLLDKALGKGE